MNIVVLCGGVSTERDVSITTGTRIWTALKERGHQAILLDLFLGLTEPVTDPMALFAEGIGLETDGVQTEVPDIAAVRALRPDQRSTIGPGVIELCQAADIVFMALHGECGENGKLQATFDLMGIRYTGCNYLGSALAMDKAMTKKLFSVEGIAAPGGITVHRGDVPYADVGFPCVVKPCSGGSSIGTSIVNDAEAYAVALEDAFKYEDDVIVERYIRGREFSVGVIEGKALPIIEIRPKVGFYDYKNKYQSGMTEELCPAPLTEAETLAMQKAAEDVFACLRLDCYARIDFMMEEDGSMYCLEANTLPGMTPMSLMPQEAAAIGVGFGELCEWLIEVSLRK